MRFADIIENDVVNGEGVCVSLFMQGCEKHCSGCFNPDTWDFEGGKEVSSFDLANYIIELLNTNGVQRNFSILGGEPLHPKNRQETLFIIQIIRHVYPDIKIWIWTGYTIEELKAMNDKVINEILDNINVLIDGPYIEAKRDLSLPYCGSYNQRIIKIK